MANNFNDALDRHITGNYGEDQFKRVCAECDRMFYDEENDVCPSCRNEEQEPPPPADNQRMR